MRAIRPVLVAAVCLGAVAGIGGLTYLKVTGLRGQPSPGWLETQVARTARGVAIPSGARARTNPLAGQGVPAEGLEHFARYCAMCHANDGSGQKTAIGGGLYPKPPDLRAEATQQLTDGELFYIIQNGVRFTGMPAFAPTSTPEGDTLDWQLVSFIRHLPRLTPAETEWMEGLNPF